jgi:hypothetical protein
VFRSSRIALNGILANDLIGTCDRHRAYRHQRPNDQRPYILFCGTYSQLVDLDVGMICRLRSIRIRLLNPPQLAKDQSTQRGALVAVGHGHLADTRLCGSWA